MKRFPMPATTLTTLNLKKTAFTLLCCTVLMLVLAGAPTAVAQSPSFTDFSSAANLALNGNAHAPVNNGTANVLRLTPALQYQAGSAWFNILQPVTGGFTTTFTFQISNTNPASPNFPADGLAFVIQNAAAGTTALGGGGGGIGYDGIPNSLAVEFDTYWNAGPGPNNDPNANHVGVQSCSTSPNSADHLATYPVPPEGSAPCNLGLNPSPGVTLADGNPHTVKIEYTSSSECGDCSSNIQVTVDDIFVLQANVDLGSKLSLAGEDSAYVGFTAATGALEENNDILSWTFTPHSSSSVNNITVPPGGTGIASFGSFNYKVHNTTTGTMNFSVKAIPLPSGTKFPPIFPTAECIVYDGTGGNCWEFEATCNSGTCDAGNFELLTSYDATGPFPMPGFLKGPAPCAGTIFATNQITEFLVQRQDPTTKGTSGGGISCWVATKSTQTPYAATVQPPINADGSSVFNAKRGVVPVKFTITMNGSPTCNLPPATIAVTRTAGGTIGSIDETVYTMAADNGSNFRVSGCQYIYNLAAAAMGPGTYEVDIIIASSKVGFATFKLK